LLPDVYIDELEKLVDEVPPVPFAPIRAAIDRNIGLEHFTRLDEQPLATASIAQIHPALLKSGREVVVKVRRPGVVEQVELDLDLLRRTARLAERRSSAARLLQLTALADELEQHLRGELDFREEAHNAELIASVIERYRDDLFVPKVVDPFVTEEVIVLERIDGVKVEEQPSLEPERAAELARVFFQAYIRQVTVAGVYHADPHRGNVLLTPDGRLALIDFGLIGRLDDDTRTSLALLLLAVAQNRADDVADLILALSLTTPESDEAGFVHELRRKLPRYHWRPLGGIRTGEALADLQDDSGVHDVLRGRAPMHIATGLAALLGKLVHQGKDRIADDIGLTAKQIEIEPRGIGLFGDLLRRSLRDHAATRLRFRQRDLDLGIARDQAHVGEHLAHARRAERIAKQNGVEHGCRRRERGHGVMSCRSRKLVPSARDAASANSRGFVHARLF